MQTDIDFEHLYKLTNRVTPLDTDCGMLCGKICCRPDPGNSLGVYLFPGEEAMFRGEMPWYHLERHNPADYDFPDNWKEPVHFLKCVTPCPRDKRPLACRFFPLAPHLLRDGSLLLIHETARLPYTCPLIAGNIPLGGDFIETVATAWQILLQDPLVHRLVAEDSREREKTNGSIPPIIWAG